MDRGRESQRTWRPAELSCPMCGSGDVRRSPGEDFLGLLNTAFGRRPFRCRSCRKRFFRHVPKSHPNPPVIELPVQQGDLAAASVPKPVHVDAAFGPGHRGIDEQNIVRHYLSGALSPEDRAAFEAHVVDCAECADRILLAEMFQVRERAGVKLHVPRSKALDRSFISAADRVS